MNIDPELFSTGSQVLSSLTNAVSTISDRVRVAKQKTNKEETINELEQIINDLIDEKQELYRTIQIYQEELIMKKISNEDVEYITQKIVPLLEGLMIENSTDDTMDNFEMLKSLLSQETFKILQLLGFNFKKAIGEPLTNLVRDFIESQNPKLEGKQLELQLLKEKINIEFMKIIQDKEAYDRYLKATNNLPDDEKNYYWLMRFKKGSWADLKKQHKIIVFSSVLTVIIGLILLNVYQTSVEKAEEAIAELEELYNREYDIVLVDNDDIKLKLINARHERTEELDIIELSFEMTNKQNRTFEYRFKNMQLDGHRDVMFGMSIHEIKPNETMILKMNAMDTKHLSFDEYISGELHYNDYAEDVLSAIETEFSAYIN